MFHRGARSAFGVALLTVVLAACSRGEVSPAPTASRPKVRVQRDVVAGGTSSAPGAFALEDTASGMAVQVALIGARTGVAGEVQPDGTVVYRGAYGDGADVIQKASAAGVEDSIAFPAAPSATQVDYALTLTSGVAGLRLVGGYLEFVDAGGSPRLRVEPPFITGADGVVQWASVAVSGCAVDEDPLPPWGRAPVAPGAGACTVSVTWDGATVAYPAMLDPAWNAAAAPSARKGHVAVRFTTGAAAFLNRVLVVGGNTAGQGSEVSSCQVYDPATNSWASCTALPAARSEAAGLLLDSGKLMVAGGRQGNGSNNGNTQIYLFDPATGAWTPASGSLSTGRWAHSAVQLSSTQVLIAGGYTSKAQAVTASAVLFNPSTGAVATTGTLATARAEFALVKTSAGVLALGGGTTAVEKYAAGAWTAASALGAARLGPVAAALGNGDVLVAGGSGAAGTLTYSFSTNAWSTVSTTVPAATYAGTLTALSNGTLLLAGGAPSTSTASVTTAGVYTGSGWAAGIPSMGTARVAHTATLLADGRVLVVGGSSNAADGTAALASAEIYAPTARGGTCASGAECASGFCVDGVCCDSVCTGQCQACDVAGQAGTCSTVTGAPHGSRAACASDGTACGGTCDGSSATACAYPGASTSCGLASCSGGTATSHTCGGAGACSNTNTTPCNPYVCGANACLTSCTSNTQCIAADWCSGSACVPDVRLPTLSLPAPITAEATGTAGAVVTYSATAADARGVALTPACSPASGATFAIQATTVTCAATDSRGNVQSGTFSVTVRDTTSPVFTTPIREVTVEATGPQTPVSYSLPTATDTASPPVTVACLPASGTGFGVGATTVTCTATDAKNNSSTAGFAVTVRDTTRPVVSVPGNMTLEATSSAGAAASFTATASDLVDGALTPICNPASGSTFAIGTATVTCSATDGHGNTGTASFTVTVQDTIKPVVAVPADMTAEATDAAGAVVTFTATATDAVAGTPAATCSPASGSTFALGTTTVTCSATDGSSNTGTASFTVTVRDTTPPAITVPSSPPTAEATGASGALVTFTVTATDAVDGTVTPVCTPASGEVFPVGDTTVTCTAADSAGNGTSASFTVTVTDLTAPVLTLPLSMTVEATDANGAMVTFDPTPAASDLVDGTVTVSCTPASGTLFAIDATGSKTTIVDCTATDAHGNKATGHFPVTVQDLTPPQLAAMPADLVVEATGATGATASWTLPAATDGVDGNVTVTCAPAPGSLFPLDQATQVTCSATDKHGNTSQGHFSVTVQDRTPPAVTVPANLTAEATGAAGATVSFSASASDAVTSNLVMSCSPASGSTFAIGTTTVACSSTDAHANTGTASFTVTVRDTTAPTVTAPGNMTLEAIGSAGATATFTATATDVVDGSLAPACSPASGSTFPLGTTTVTCTATDAHHNAASASFTVTVKDTVAPVVSVPGNMTLEAASAAGATATFAATATDAVAGNPAPSCSPASGSTFPLGTTTVTCSSTDGAGNTGSASFTVTVRDTTKPVVSVPSNMTLEAASAAGATATFTATATDAVAGSPATICGPVSGSTFPLGPTTVTCTATDGSGNTGTASFTVTVSDTTAPVVTVPSDLTAEATDAAGAVVTFTATATDAVAGTPAATCSPASGSTFLLGATSVTCSATDGSSNTGTASFTVTVRDTTPPAITVPSSPPTAEATGASGALVTFTVTATDAVDGTVTPVCTPASGEVFPVGDTTVTCTAADSAGNGTSASFTVTVTDLTAPVLTLPLSMTVEATGADGATVTFDPAPSASDLVDGTVTVSCTPASGTLFAIDATGSKTTIVDCTATDTHGNTATGHFPVTVQDLTPPQLAAMPADLVVEATGATGATATWTLPAATDGVDASVTVTCAPAPGSLFPLAAAPTTVTCTATDKHANTSQGHFKVTVQDTTPPVVTVPADMSVNGTVANGATATFSATATDLVDGSVPVTCIPASGSRFPVGPNTVTCTATDAHGRTGTATFTVNVTADMNLEVQVTGPAGLVTSAGTPSPMSCTSGSCTAVVKYGINVVLTAVSTNPGVSVFKGWEGCSSVTADGKCNLPMFADRHAVARFEPATYPLAISYTGPGTGSVGAKANGALLAMSCGVTGCTATVPNGAEVVLTETPAQDKLFMGWAIACAGTGSTCSFAMNGPTSVQAAFAPSTYTLGVTVAGAGVGSVASSPAGIISCAAGSSAGCSASFANGAVVTLTASYDPATVIFTGWSSGACSGSGATCKVTMDAAKGVVATFEPATYALTASLAGAGAGSVSGPGLSACTTANPAGCTANEANGGAVTLTAVADANSKFTGWAGCSSSSGANCTVYMTSARGVTATFEPARYPLTVNLDGAFTGTITGTADNVPLAIACGPTSCTGMAPNGAKVILTEATAGVFLGWGIPCTGSGPTCTFTMNSAKTILATFAPPSYELTVATGGAGAGSVSSSAGGIACATGSSASCSATFTYGASIVLTASPGAGSLFTGWAGGYCSGTTPTCTVAMDSAKSVTARFDPPTYPLTVTVGGAGSGSVSGPGVGNPLSCTTGSTAGCTANEPRGPAVTLTATPGPNSVLTGWSGCSSSSGNTCTVYMTSARSVTATFQPATYPLTLSFAGTGAGSVSGVTWSACTSTGCTGSVANGATVSLTASASSGSTFKGWGIVCTGTAKCSIKMNAAKTVQATFSSP